MSSQIPNSCEDFQGIVFKDVFEDVDEEKEVGHEGRVGNEEGSEGLGSVGEELFGKELDISTRYRKLVLRK